MSAGKIFSCTAGIFLKHRNWGKNNRNQRLWDIPSCFRAEGGGSGEKSETPGAVPKMPIRSYRQGEHSWPLATDLVIVMLPLTLMLFLLFPPRPHRLDIRHGGLAQGRQIDMGEEEGAERAG